MRHLPLALLLAVTLAAPAAAQPPNKAAGIAWQEFRALARFVCVSRAAGERLAINIRLAGAGDAK